MKILYLSNYEVPYRANFFTLLAKETDLTVAYQYDRQKERNVKWSRSGRCDYSHIYLMKDGGGWLSAVRNLMKLLSRNWDIVVIGCYNDWLQILAKEYLRVRKKTFVINLDGEAFIGKSWKGMMKRLALKGASAYLTAGEVSASTLKDAVGNAKPVFPYYFSSLNKSDLKKADVITARPAKEILIPGRYSSYKGLDVAMDVARNAPDLNFTFVGMDECYDRFIDDFSPIPGNVKVIPFLQTQDLYELYRKSTIMMLPSRRECWGLVVNEAASVGVPIVSTTGSGAAVEFLSEKYPQYLAEPELADSLMKALRLCLDDISHSTEYSEFLVKKGAEYNIERSVAQHLKCFNAIASHPA